MQKKVQIVSDGSLDLSQEITKEHDIEVVKKILKSFPFMCLLTVRHIRRKWWN